MKKHGSTHTAKSPNTATVIGYPDALNDPTNGTMSWGRLFRTNKGIVGK